MNLFRPLLTQSFKTTGIYLLIIALTLAISATTALKFSNEQIQNAVALQAAEMLAGDLLPVITSQSKIPGVQRLISWVCSNRRLLYLAVWHIPMTNLSWSMSKPLIHLSFERRFAGQTRSETAKTG